jgi:hypothetical protein
MNTVDLRVPTEKVAANSICKAVDIVNIHNIYLQDLFSFA